MSVPVRGPPEVAKEFRKWISDTLHSTRREVAADAAFKEAGNDGA
jgi:hypothetical protein